MVDLAHVDALAGSSIAWFAGLAFIGEHGNLRGAIALNCMLQFTALAKGKSRVTI
jgi:hypothetical protein